MSLPLPLAGAAILFTEKITAFDATITRVSGRDQKVVSADRIISGVIQSEKQKEIELKSDGALSDGLLRLHTRAEVFIADMSQDTGEGIAQTYIRYQGEVWKLNKTDVGWAEKTQGFRKYIMTKYTNVDEL